MRRPLIQFALLALLTSGQAGLQAAPIRLDDSLTHTVPPNVQMQWRSLAAPRDAAATMEAWVRVNVRIDTRPVQNRNGKVYLVFSRDDSSVLEAVWTTQGLLQPGRVTSGDRTLVYSGLIQSPALEDQFLMRLRSQADWQSGTRRLQFHFEFDGD